MNSGPPLVSDLVLVGGGHAHVHVLKMLGMPKYRPKIIEYGIRVTLIAQDIHTPYSGMLPGYVAGHYTHDDIHLDLNKLCRFANVILIHAACNKITYNNNNNNNNGSGGGGGFCFCNDGRPPIRYDCLSIDIGSAPTETHESLIQHPRVMPVKPISNFTKFYHQLQTATNHDKNNHKKRIVCVVGGGAGGIELALSVQYNLLQQQQQQKRQSNNDNNDNKNNKVIYDNEHLQIVLITRGMSLLEEHNRGVQKIFHRVMKERNIQIIYGAEIECVQTNNNNQDRSLLIPSKSSKQHTDPIPFDDCFWCTSAAGAGWLSSQTPFATNEKGFLRINDTFELLHHQGVFAAGDCCHMDKHPRPKAGVFAVRAGPPLVENIIRYMTTNLPLKSFKPQESFLGLISTGDPYAIASKGKFLCLEGSWIWKLKDYIDVKWMRQYNQDLPDVQEMMSKMKLPNPAQNKIPKNLSNNPSIVQAFAADPMRCGGCGAKVGSTTLSRVLKALYQRQVQRAIQYNLPKPPPIDHDDAAITLLPTIQSNNGHNNNNGNSASTAAIVNTIDYFRSLLSDPYLFGKVVAVHALSDVHAMGTAVAQSALALAVVPFAANEAITESTLLQLLSGISDVLQDENISIIGGHTCEGLELACGLCVQGYTSNAKTLLRKRGGQVGDDIILTKPLGTGALFAADMRAKCKGEYMQQAIQSMVQSNGIASKIVMERIMSAKTNNNNDNDNNASSLLSTIRSCTDVTGFGLIGHLLEMLMANDNDNNQDYLQSIGAELYMDQIPFLKGGIEASQNEIYSTLQPQNAKNRRAVINHGITAKQYPIEYPLLFDPQTAGGLLLFVQSSETESLLQDFHAAGIKHARCIGKVVTFHNTNGSGSNSHSKNDNNDEVGVCTLADATLLQRIKII